MSGIQHEHNNLVQNGESRTVLRRRSYFHGKIVSRDGAFSLDCIIRNLSESGARIQVGGHELLSLRFFLLCTALKKTFDAEIMWRKDEFAGLIFHAVHDMTANVPPALKVVQRFFAEHAARPSSGLYGE